MRHGELGVLRQGETRTPFSATVGKYALRVQARGQQGCGLWPVLNLYVDEDHVGTAVIASTELTTYEFPEVVLHSEGEHSLGLEFVQAGTCTAPGQERQLVRPWGIRGENRRPGGIFALEPGSGSGTDRGKLS
jgi:hypothetical protein